MGICRKVYECIWRARAGTYASGVATPYINTTEHACTHIYIYIYMCINEYMQIYAYTGSYVYLNKGLDAVILACMHVHIHTYVYIYAYIYAGIHVRHACESNFLIYSFACPFRITMCHHNGNSRSASGLV